MAESQPCAGRQEGFAQPHRGPSDVAVVWPHSAKFSDSETETPITQPSRGRGPMLLTAFDMASSSRNRSSDLGFASGLPLGWPGLRLRAATRDLASNHPGELSRVTKSRGMPSVAGVLGE